MTLSTAERLRIVQEADAACRGQVVLLGLGTVACGDPIDWHRDPVTGRRFPARAYDSDRGTDIDWRFLDELNMHRHFFSLAQAAYLTGEARYGRTLQAQLQSWLEANPPILDIYIHSVLQCALRVIAWIWSLYLLRSARMLTTAGESFMIAAIDQHTRFIATHEERDRPSYNHRVGEAAALVIAGIALPLLPAAEAWRARGLAILTDEAEHQFGTDGHHCEQAFGYHLFVLEAYLHVLILCRQRDIATEPRLDDAVLRMLAFTRRVIRPDGELPAIGDEGLRWHQLTRRPMRAARDLLAAGAVLFQSPELKTAAGSFGDEAQWLLGRAGLERFAGITEGAAAARSITTGDSGAVVWRTGWSAQDDYLLLDAGAQGVGPAGHGHADALSIDLSVRGVPFLIDAGTFTYNLAEQTEWRRYFRGTSAHNTVGVDDRDQADSTRWRFAWVRPARARLRLLASSPALAVAEAEHDGYERCTPPITHRRLLCWLQPWYWMVCDIIEGSGEHSCESTFHFAPDVVLTDSAGAHRAHAGTVSATLRALDDPTWTARALRGSAEPRQGWVSQEYGAKMPASVLTFRRVGALPCLFAAAIARDDTARPGLAALTAVPVIEGHPVPHSQAVCIRLHFTDGACDYFYWSTAERRRTAGDLETDASVAFVRVAAGGAACGNRIGGSTLCWRGSPITAPADLGWQDVSRWT